MYTLVPPSYRCFIENLALIGQAVSEEKIFEIVDGRTDGQTPDHGHPISSGELKRYNPAYPRFFYIKVGFKGVFVAWTCPLSYLNHFNSFNRVPSVGHRQTV